MSEHMYGELYERHSGDANGDSERRIYIYGVERSVHRDGKLRGDDECSGVGDSFVYGDDVRVDGDGSGDGNGNRDEQPIGDLVPKHMRGEFRERGIGDAERNAGKRIDIRRVERGLHGNGKLRGDDERGGVGDGDV